MDRGQPTTQVADLPAACHGTDIVALYLILASCSNSNTKTACGEGSCNCGSIITRIIIDMNDSAADPSCRYQCLAGVAATVPAPRHDSQPASLCLRPIDWLAAPCIGVRISEFQDALTHLLHYCEHLRAVPLLDVFAVEHNARPASHHMHVALIKSTLPI